MMAAARTALASRETLTISIICLKPWSGLPTSQATASA